MTMNDCYLFLRNWICVQRISSFIISPIHPCNSNVKLLVFTGIWGEIHDPGLLWVCAWNVYLTVYWAFSSYVFCLKSWPRELVVLLRSPCVIYVFLLVWNTAPVRQFVIYACEKRCVNTFDLHTSLIPEVLDRRVNLTPGQSQTESWHRPQSSVWNVRVQALKTRAKTF